jgi:D-tyrosyl-tRNA(Tyr) deacylase
MRAVIQRVIRAQVNVGEEVVGKIGAGLVVLLGVAKTDASADADYLAAKILGLRIFEDHGGKMNLSVTETGGAVHAVSQFTLYGDVRKGKRPSFDEAAPPQVARELYEHFVAKIREAGVHLRNRMLPGHDAGRTGERGSGDDPARFRAQILISDRPTHRHNPKANARIFCFLGGGEWRKRCSRW